MVARLRLESLNNQRLVKQPSQGTCRLAAKELRSMSRAIEIQAVMATGQDFINSEAVRVGQGRPVFVGCLDGAEVRDQVPGLAQNPHTSSAFARCSSGPRGRDVVK
jgi:hypothetical protein